MLTNVPYIITNRSVTVNLDGVSHSINRDNKISEEIIKALKEQKFNLIPDLVSKSKQVEKFGKGHFQVIDGIINIDGIAVPEVLSNKILQFLEEDLPSEPLIKFAANLNQNPSYNSRQQLYSFLERYNLCLTEDGHFLSYKAVRDNYKDIYSGKIDNTPGTVVEMPRLQVDDNSNNGCSSGLHCGDMTYVINYGGRSNTRFLEVKVNPRDVVSVPEDHNYTKIRVCKYLVLKEIHPQTDNTNKTYENTSRDYENHEDDYDNDDCCRCCSFECECKCEEDLTNGVW